MFAPLRRPNGPRRGVTLVEMLVVVALVVLMMVILVQIFQAATGAIQASRTIQELDVTLRAIDSMIRSDLAGATAKMTPPNDPNLKSGYLEYIENAPADAQGEDSDDILALTTKAPEGTYFTGRQWLSNLAPNGNGGSNQSVNQAIQPITITSEVAEVIYFLRNGNLYRRVFLVVPDRSKAVNTDFIKNAQNIVVNSSSNIPVASGGGFTTTMFGGSLNVSWIGMTDISARPGGFTVDPVTGNSVPLPPIPNDLGALTNRENRAFHQRFQNDFVGSKNGGDGVPDDNNGDGVPDYYPTLYFDGNGANVTGAGWAPCGGNNGTNVYYGVHEYLPYPTMQRVAQGGPAAYNVYAFPFVYPGMYSVPDPNRVNTALGWVHWLQPTSDSNNNNLYIPNHAPLDLGDNVVLPTGGQTWWGYPTWRETMAGTSSGGVGWTDPVDFVGVNGFFQPLGLQPNNPASTPTLASNNFLPPVPNTGTAAFSDGAGSASFVANPNAPTVVWQDDLILSNVRSFDVKAYDLDAPLYNSTTSGAVFSAGYYDLGYGGLQYNPANPAFSSPVAGKGLPASVYGPNGSGYSVTGQTGVPWQAVGGEPLGFGHEGRVPPNPGDFRMHPRRGFNVGDPNPGVNRMVHTFDTWSTDYVNAPDYDVLLDGYAAGTVPIYPSFNAPYPSPLRGIQIQIRVVDPRNERAKSITIRHDFTDKL